MAFSLPEILSIGFFLVLVSIWLFVRPGEYGDRLFLAIAGVIYIGTMLGIFWAFGKSSRHDLRTYVLLHTTGFILVLLSRRLSRKKSSQ